METNSQYLKNGHKFYYTGHNDGWMLTKIKEVMLFNGSNDTQLAPVPPVASEIILQIENLVGRCLGRKCQLC